MHDQRTSADPPEATVAVASPPPADRAREVDYLLDRLLAGERTLMRVIEALTPSPSFAEVFAFYRESGFLYPAKLASLQPRLAAIEETWRALLNGDPAIFRLIARRGYANGQFELNSTTSAFAYAPGTWQAQHLVNGERGEYIGTLSVLMDMMEWLHHSGAEYMRFYFRPSNPGTNRLFGDLLLQLPAHLVSLAHVDYGVTPVRAVHLPAAEGPRIRIRRSEAPAAAKIYAQLLQPVELGSLALADPRIAALDASYREHGLTRRRTVLVAFSGRTAVGACLVNYASEGINFSFVENAIEHLRVAPDLPPASHRAVWLSLLREAVTEIASRRDSVVAALHPHDRHLALETKLVATTPKQYAVFTATRRERTFLRMSDSFADYYRERLRALAPCQEPA